MENLTEDEMPHRAIWNDDERLSEWFDLIKRRRRDDNGSGGAMDNAKQNLAAKDLIVGG